MFKDYNSQCPNIVDELKTSIESNLLSSEPDYTKYYNFPSCSSADSDWSERYWGTNVEALENIKTGE